LEARVHALESKISGEKKEAPVDGMRMILIGPQPICRTVRTC
jgi:hypothetical protein